MKHLVFDTKAECGAAAAADGAQRIRRAIADRGQAGIILATGTSQFEMIEALARAGDLDWQKVTAFHLDEYVGLSIRHPASFRKYLSERFASRLPTPLGAFHYLDGEAEPQAVCRQIGDLLRRCPIDVAFIGIGENGHLAFNDPPADFKTRRPYLVLSLDDPCRRQQVGEGWFPTIDEVPAQAISMSVHRILQSRAIVCTAPDERKARAVLAAVTGPVTPDVPASILRRHGDTTIYLDRASALLLGG